MKNFLQNQRDCVRKLSKLPAVIANALNYLLIGLVLAHEILKSITMFEHDTSFSKILWCWLLSSGSNLISSIFAWFEPLPYFTIFFFFSFWHCPQMGQFKRVVKALNSFDLFFLFFVCFYFSPPATLHFKYNTNELPGLNILLSTFCSFLYLDIRIFYCIQNYSPIASVQS